MKKLTMSFYDYDLKIVISGLKEYKFKDYSISLEDVTKLKWIAKRDIVGFFERENGRLDLVLQFKDKKDHYAFVEYNAAEIKKHFKTQNLSYWSERVKPLI